MAETLVADKLKLYTIGHSDLSASLFLNHLSNFNVRVVVDVRSVPASKFVPHFNKHPLEQLLTQHGIEYRFAGDFLGGRPVQADVYKSNQVPNKDTKREDFLELVQYTEIIKRDWYQKGIIRLFNLISQAEQESSTVAILCSEGNPRECHRHHLITRSLVDPQMKIVDRDIQVFHILRNGEAELVNASEFENLLVQPRLF